MKKILSYSKPSFTVLVALIVSCYVVVVSTCAVLAHGRLTRHHDSNNTNQLLRAESPVIDLENPSGPPGVDLTVTDSDLAEDDTSEPDSEHEPAEDADDDNFAFSSDLIIKSVNPGYKIDGVSDVGELIELQNLSDSSISLASFFLRYTNGSGKQTVIVKFPEGSLMTGEYLLLGYQKSNDGSADMLYTNSLALNAGPLELIYEDEVVDTVCWTGKEHCAKSFKSSNPTTLVRNLKTGEFQHDTAYTPYDNSASNNLYLPPEIPEDPEVDDNDGDSDDASHDKSQSDDEKPLAPKCTKLEFTEIFSYYAEDHSEQFVELFNAGDHEIDLEGCQLKYKNKTYPLSGYIKAGAYLAYYPENNFSLTKNPTTSNSIFLLDVNKEVIDELIYEHGQKKSASYAKFYDQDGSETWRQTYLPTPNAANQFQEFRTCPTGKVINPLTGNCVNATSVLGATETKECPAGKYRNPLTGRCKNIETASAPKECAEGYERNPETNRCRKITKENEGADFALVPNTSSSSQVFTAIGIVILIIIVGVVYIVLQFRYEIIRAARKVRQRFNRVRQNLFAGKIGRNRNKKP